MCGPRSPGSPRAIRSTRASIQPRPRCPLNSELPVAIDDEAVEHVNEAALAQLAHPVAERADTGQDQPSRTLQIVSVARDQRCEVQALDSADDGAGIAEPLAASWSTEH